MEDRFKEYLIFKPETMNLPHLVLKPMGTAINFVHKWIEFLRYLFERQKVAMVILEGWELLLPPPTSAPVASSLLKAYYRPCSVPLARTNNFNAGPSLIQHTGHASPGDLSLFSCALCIFGILDL